MTYILIYLCVYVYILAVAPNHNNISVYIQLQPGTVTTVADYLMVQCMQWPMLRDRHIDIQTLRSSEPTAGAAGSALWSWPRHEDTALVSCAAICTPQP